LRLTFYVSHHKVRRDPSDHRLCADNRPLIKSPPDLMMKTGHSRGIASDAVVLIVSSQLKE